MPFYFKRKLFLLCEYRDRHNTAFYYNDKLDIWYNSLTRTMPYQKDRQSNKSKLPGNSLNQSVTGGSQSSENY